MSVFMRAVLADWHQPPFEELATFVAQTSSFRVQAAEGRGWADFEALDHNGNTVLAADLWIGSRAREELEELEDWSSPASPDSVGLSGLAVDQLIVG